MAKVKDGRGSRLFPGKLECKISPERAREATANGCDEAQLRAAGKFREPLKGQLKRKLASWLCAPGAHRGPRSPAEAELPVGLQAQSAGQATVKERASPLAKRISNGVWLPLRASPTRGSPPSSSLGVSWFSEKGFEVRMEAGKHWERQG